MVIEEQHTRIDAFVDHLINFDDFGIKTEVVDSSSASDTPPLRYYINEFWTSTQRAGHALHEISYRACFKPQLPEFFISRLTQPSDIVYDPFMGRGTTPIQTAIMDRQPVGNDANPISMMVTRPRLNTPSQSEVEERLNEIDWNSTEPTDQDRPFTAFYHESTLRQITSLREWLRRRGDSCAFDHTDDWIRLVAISRLTGHSPGFFSVYTLPPNQAASIESQRRINQRRNQTPPKRDVKTLIAKKSQSLLRHGELNYPGPVLTCTDARNTDHIEDNAVDLVVTSPPFLDTVDYLADNHVRAWFANIIIDEGNIETTANPKNWQNFTAQTLRELCRVVKPGGIICYEVGEIRNATLNLENLVHDAIQAAGLPVHIIGVLVNQQEFSKTANVWGVTNNSKGTNTNRVVMMAVLE